MTNWLHLAACKAPGVDPAIFYPDPPAGHNADYSAAKAVCAGCPVSEPCLELGMGDRYGVWGNTSPNERARLRRERDDTLACTGCGARVPITGGRGRTQQPWCSSEDCQRECARLRTIAWRRRGVA